MSNESVARTKPGVIKDVRVPLMLNTIAAEATSEVDGMQKVEEPALT